MHLLSVLCIITACVDILISNLVALAWRRYTKSLPPLNSNISTLLNNALFNVYNLFITFMCLVAVIEAGNLEMPLLPRTLLNLAAVICLLVVGGLLIAIAAIRLLLVVNFYWISEQDYQVLGRKILLIVFVLSAGIIGLTSRFFSYQQETLEGEGEYIKVLKQF
jgi:hypothetical protein